MPIGRGMKVEIKETSGYGLVRITEYEVGLINYLYLVSLTRFRCIQLGLSMADLELLSIDLINDMYAESRNDDCKYAELATQEDFDRF